MTTENKISYIEYIRVYAAVAVVFLHIVMTLNNNYEINELGVFNYTVFSDCYMLVKWAVPCFIMITGTLLLNPMKSVDVQKIKKYVLRMIEVLLTFGVLYALMEIIFTEKTFHIGMFLKALLHTAEGQSWSHMWYIYALIPMYIIALPLRDFIKAQNRKTIQLFIIVLIVGNFIVPTINAVFNIDIKTLMPFGEYITYFVIGYYLSTLPIKFISRTKPILIGGGWQLLLQ